MNKMLVVISMGAMTLVTTCASGALDRVSGGVAPTAAPAAPSDVALLTEYQRELRDRLDGLGDFTRQVTHLTELLDLKNGQLDTMQADVEARDETITTLTRERDSAIAERDAAEQRLENIEAELFPPEEGSE